MITKKAGCVLLDFRNKKVGLVYRTKRDDYSFPKGHLEMGESLEECAIRETEEETGRLCHIIKPQELTVLTYNDSKGDSVECYYYLASDDGKSSKVFADEDKEKLIWKEIEEVEGTLSHQDLKTFWNNIKMMVAELLK